MMSCRRVTSRRAAVCTTAASQGENPHQGPVRKDEWGFAFVPDNVNVLCVNGCIFCVVVSVCFCVPRSLPHRPQCWVPPVDGSWLHDRGLEAAHAKSLPHFASTGHARCCVGTTRACYLYICVSSKNAPESAEVTPSQCSGGRSGTSSTTHESVEVRGGWSWGGSRPYAGVVGRTDTGVWSSSRTC